MSDATELRDAKIRICREVEIFQSSDLGREMITLSALRGHKALVALSKVKPTDTDTIMLLQNEVRCGDLFVEYMNQLTEAGKAELMQQQLEESDD